MKIVKTKPETVINILIVAVAILAAGLIAERFFSSPVRQSAKNEITPAVGTKINLPGVDWTQRSQTLVMALQKDCRFCTDSAPFYQKLVKSAVGKDIRILAVLAQSREAGESYLNKLGISGVEIKSATPNELQVRGTPTLIVVNEKGEVTNVWTGSLPPEQEAEVFRQLKL
jgi:thioredoxin-related protein